MARELGDKLGPRLVNLVVNATLATRRQLAGHEAKVRAAGTQIVIDRIGREIADLYRPFVAELLSSEDAAVHPLVEQFMRQSASGTHQAQAASGLLFGFAQSVISGALSNAFAPVAYRINETGPNLVPDPGLLAEMAAAGVIDLASGATGAAWQGYSGTQFDRLVEHSRTDPGAAAILDMLNRRLIGAGEAELVLERQGMRPELRAPFLATRAALLAPADLALAVLRGEMTQAEGQTLASLSGVSASDFAILTLNTGEPPAVESLLEARRRGFIDAARLLRGIRQSRVRDEWSDVIEKLSFSPMSTADAVEAWVQGHLSEAASRAKASQNGLEAADWDPLAATAGEPLSRTELEQLYNRGQVSQADVEQGLRESRLKNKYIPLAFDLHVRLPEPRQVVSALTHGAVTKDTATRLLAEQGFAPQSIAILVQEGTNARLVTHHNLTLAEIRSLYIEGVFTKAHTGQLVSGLGYDTADAASLISSWDLIAAAAITRQAIGVVRGRYVARRYNENQASSYLDSLGVPSTARDKYLKLWNIEREATIAVLTEAQIVSAHKRALISGDDAFKRLTAKGYDAGDAKILLGAKPDGPVPK